MLLGKLGKKMVEMLPSWFVIHMGTLWGLGYKSRMPGTLGSLAGVVMYSLVFYHLNGAEYFVLAVILIYVGIVFCGEAEVRLRKHDPGEIILDEFVAMPLCFIGMGYVYERYPVWGVLLVGFLLFRFFDILKPLGISKIQRVRGGGGCFG